MTIDTPALPASYEWGFVVGQIIEAIADQSGDDNRFPESRPVLGRVIFEPLTPLRKVSTPVALFVAHKKVVAELNDNGEIMDADGYPGVWLVTGSYRVSFKLVDAEIKAFNIEVTSAHTIGQPLNLATATPYVPEDGATVVLVPVPAGTSVGSTLIWTANGLAWGGQSGILEVSGSVTLPPDGPRVVQMYATGTATINGEVFAVDTALVARRTAAGVWQVAVVDSGDWRAFSVAPTVTATAPTFTDVSGTGSDTYTIPAKANVVYKAAGATKAAGTYPGSGTVTVTAEAASGYALTGASSWSHTFSTGIIDTTPPAAGTLAASATTATGFTATVSGASDAVALHATPYAFSTNNGSTWTAWQASAVYVASGLTASTGYQARHKVRDAAGNEATGTAIPVTTAAMPLSGDIADDFNSTNTVDMNGRSTPVGAATWTTPWEMGLGTGAVGINTNRAYSTGNGSAKVTVAQQDLTLTCTYDVTNASAQVRLFARAEDGGSMTGTGCVIAIVANSGMARYQLGSAASIDLGAAPTTGKLALECIGTVGRVLVNDVQVGGTFVIPTGSRVLAGFGVYLNGKADDFQVVYA